MTDGYLSARHAAAYLDMSYAAFDQMVRRQGIPHKRYGRIRRFLKSDLEAAGDVLRLRLLRKKVA